MNIENAISLLQEMFEDNTVPKNVRARIDKTIKVLQENAENKIKVSRALYELEEIGNDINVQPYTRTQLFNVVSMLEIV